jgi:hypothetical protein
MVAGRIAKLVAVDDVAAIVEQPAGNGTDQAGLIRTGKVQYEFQGMLQSIRGWRQAADRPPITIMPSVKNME